MFLCDGTVNDAAECDGLDSKVDDCTDMVEYNDTVAVQQNDTDTDIAKDDDTVAAQQDGTDINIAEHDDTLSVDTLDLVYQLPTSSGRIPRLMQFLICHKALFMNSTSGNNLCTNKP